MVRILFSLILLVSALTKLFFYEEYELLFLENCMGSWLTTPFMLRMVIGFEIWLSLFALICSKKTLKIAGIILTIAYFYGTINALTFTGTSVILALPFKNFILIAIAAGLLALIFMDTEKLFSLKKRKNLLLLNLSFVVVAFSTTLLGAPIFIDDFQETTEEIAIKPEWKGIMEKLDQNGIHYQDNTLIAFVSTNCFHCNRVARLLGATSRTYKNANIVMVFAGTQADAKQFMDNNAANFPHIFIDKETFLTLAGYSFPSFFLMQNDQYLHWTGRTFNYAVLNKLFNS